MDILSKYNIKYSHFDILSDDEVRQGKLLFRCPSGLRACTYFGNLENRLILHMPVILSFFIIKRPFGEFVMTGDGDKWCREVNGLASYYRTQWLLRFSPPPPSTQRDSYFHARMNYFTIRSFIHLSINSFRIEDLFQLAYFPTTLRKRRSYRRAWYREGNYSFYPISLTTRKWALIGAIFQLFRHSKNKVIFNDLFVNKGLCLPTRDLSRLNFNCIMNTRVVFA